MMMQVTHVKVSNFLPLSNGGRSERKVRSPRILLTFVLEWLHLLSYIFLEFVLRQNFYYLCLVITVDN